MKRVLKWTAIVVVSLIIIITISAFVLAARFNSECEKEISFTPESIEILKDSASLERGRILSVGCRSCHGVDLGGKIFFDDPNIGSMAASNLTRAVGSETEGYTDVDFVRAIRHGLNNKGNKLMTMPSLSCSYMSDQDLGCLIGFIQSLPPIDRKFDKRNFTFLSKAMAGAGMFGDLSDLFHYDIIDHEKAVRIPSVSKENTLAYGSYLVDINGCKECHTKNLKGGPAPDPASPPVPDISMSSPSGKWTQEQFIQFFRTGTTPDGRTVGEFMPFAGLGAFSDVEIAAVYQYIQSMK